MSLEKHVKITRPLALRLTVKVECVFPMVVYGLSPHTKLERNDRRESSPKLVKLNSEVEKIKLRNISGTTLECFIWPLVETH